MSKLGKLREELEALKKEILSKHSMPDSATAPESSKGETSPGIQETVEHQITELNRMVKTMIDDAETTVADHPVATVAGALALGIAIGRLTAR